MDLTQIPVLPTSAGALVAIIVLLILRGQLVPKSAVDDVRADRDMWKTAYESQVSRNKELTDTVTNFMEVARTTESVIRTAAEAGGPNEAIPTQG